jgi:hypothetical protein
MWGIVARSALVTSTTGASISCKTGTNVDGHEFQHVPLKSSLPYFRIDALDWTSFISRLGELKESLP